MASWSKGKAERWGKQFIKMHEVVPSAGLRRNHSGPPDKELIRMYGSVKKALEDWGAPLQTQSLKGPGIAMKYDHANGVLTGTREKREALARAHPMRVLCAHCDWDEQHADGLQALAAQQQHLEAAHGVTPENRPRQRWKNGASSFPPSGVTPGNKHDGWG